MTKFIEASTYDNLCDECRALLAGITTEMEENGADTDNEEAPCDYMYDHRMFCGGHECSRDGEDDLWRGRDVDQENPVNVSAEDWLEIFARNPEAW